VYTDYGYGYVDLDKHGSDLQHESKFVVSIIEGLKEDTESEDNAQPTEAEKQSEQKDPLDPKEESKVQKVPSIPAKFDQVKLITLSDLKPHLPPDKFREVERTYDAIIRVNFLNGAIGGIRRRNISSRITIRVKTMHGKRLSHSIEVSIFDRVKTVIDKLMKIDQDDMVRYISYKLLLCMGKMQALDLKKLIWQCGLKNDTQLLFVGNRNFQWDPNGKGQDIYVSSHRHPDTALDRTEQP
jgi:hypothetical protein